MRAENSVFAAVCTSPRSIRELKEELNFSESSIYHAVSRLRDQKLINAPRRGKEVVVEVADNYRGQKLKEIFIKAMANGANPEFLVSDNTLRVWKELRSSKGLEDLVGKTGLSYPTVHKICKSLRETGLVKVIRKNPLLLVLNESHPVNRSLKSYMEARRMVELPYLGHLPTELAYGRPEDIERVLLEGGEGISLPGFRLRGERMRSIKALEHVTPASIFLEELKRPEGAEAFCPHILKLANIDYDELLKLAEKNDMVNEVGCYLDIIRDLNPKLIPAEAIQKFLPARRKVERTFYRKEKKYGGDDRLRPYGETWNLNLYLDYDALKRNVEGVA